MGQTPFFIFIAIGRILVHQCFEVPWREKLLQLVVPEFGDCLSVIRGIDLCEGSSLLYGDGRIVDLLQNVPVEVIEFILPSCDLNIKCCRGISEIDAQLPRRSRRPPHLPWMRCLLPSTD